MPSQLPVKEIVFGGFGPRSGRLDDLAAYFHGQQKELTRFAFYVCGDWATAEDFVQDAFLRVYKHKHAVQRDGFTAYTRQTILNMHRSAAKRRMLERRCLSRVQQSFEVSFETYPADHEPLWLAIMQLSERQRACVALRYYEDMTEADIAVLLGITPGSVRRHVDRALTRLRREVDEIL